MMTTCYNSSNYPDDGPSYLAYFEEQFAQPCLEEESVLNEEELALIERIREAFRGVRLEDGIGLMQAEVKDDYACEEIEAFLAQHEEREVWELLTASHLNACSCALSYVDAKGFRFLIPAFVIHDIKGLLCWEFTYLSLTYDLHPTLDFDQKQFLAGKCALLSEVQQSALQEYIRYDRIKNEDILPSLCSLWDTEDDRIELKRQDTR